MTRAESIELLAIGLVAAISWLVQPYLPPIIPLWQIVLGVSALLLGQSLVRDVAILTAGPENEWEIRACTREMIIGDDAPDDSELF